MLTTARGSSSGRLTRESASDHCAAPRPGAGCGGSGAIGRLRAGLCAPWISSAARRSDGCAAGRRLVSVPR